MKLYLSHNPYRIETVFRIDDKNCEDPWFKKLSCADGMPARLQMWIGQFFDRLHEAYPDKDRFCLTYKGTSADCCDVEEEASSAAARLGVEIKVVKEACGDPEAKFQVLRQLYREAVTGPYDAFHKLEMEGDFQRVEDRLLSVSIMAPMKNGKSTLLNSILGCELLPHATQRCTAKISYIEHCDGMDGFEAKRIADDGTASEYLICDMNLLSKWNSSADVQSVMIRGALPGIKVDDYRLQFVDTPGPDSAVHKEDQITIDRFLSDNSLPMVCYIIDRINSAEERYLARLKEQMSRFGKQSADRFIFVISRMDQISVEKGDSKEENQIKAKIEGIREDLSKLGIQNPRIIPVSAKIALKAREYGTLGKDNQEDAGDDMKKFRKGLKRIKSTLLDYSSVSSAIRNKIEAEVAEIQEKIDAGKDDLKDHLRLAELLSGIPTLEMAIEEYVTKYSVPARIYDAATIFDQGIQKAHAVEALVAKVEEGETSVQEIGEKIEKLRHSLFQREGIKEMREMLFPAKWVESRTLKKALSETDHDFDVRVREKLTNLKPNTRETKTLMEFNAGYCGPKAHDIIKPDEAKDFVKGFVAFMDELSNEMLSVYSNHVEEDARASFKNLKAQYDAKITEIMGEMPKELKDFMEHVRFVLEPNAHMKFDVDKIITHRTEVRHVKREITREDDGLVRFIWARLPFTDTTVEETITCSVEQVNYQTLMRCLRQAANDIRQSGLDKAEHIAETKYGELRELMMKQFDSIDVRLREFEKELQENLSAKENESQRMDEYRQTLAWVRKFQEKLGRVLNLEA